MYGKSLAILLAIAPISFLTSSCIKDMTPIFVQSQNLIDEASEALAKAEAIIVAAGDNIPIDKKIKLQRAIIEAHSALQKANVAIRKAKDEYENPNYPAIFKEFNAAWTIIREILPFILAESNRLGISPTAVDDPIVYSLK